jgi:putative ABC transport system permease protein
MINGQAHTIIGVMPDGFFFDRHFELWTPWQMPADVATKRDMRFQGVARLKPGMTPQAVQVEADAVLRSIAPEDARKGWHVRLVSLHSSLTGSSRSALLVLFGAVGFVLLIACVNVANLLLARSLDRSKEIAVRAALGASRLRLVRAQLTESLLLGGLGGVAGLLLAGWGIRTLLMLFPRNIGVPRLDTVHIDTTVLLFTLGLSLVTGIAFGLIPALQAANTNLNKALKEGARSFGSGLRPHRLRNSLVVLETALSLVLLIGAGLMLRSFERLLRVNPGFNPEGVLTLRVPLPPAITKKPDQVAYYTRILERLQSLPGVNSVGLTTPLPLAGVSSNISFYVAGRPVPQGEMETVKLRVVSPGFFRAMSLALVRGRVFDASDGAGSPEVAVINETLARRYFPNQDPIGRRVSASDNPDTKGYTVVGVIHDVKELDLSGQPEPEMYRDFRQFFFAPFATTFALRTSVRDPMALAATVQKEIRVLNPDQPISDLMTMREVVSANIAQPRFYTLLLGLFAATALVLAVAGLYGVLSYSVNQRLHEIGVRMALGACRSDVLRMIVRQGLFLTLVGLVLGIIGAFALTRFLTSVLYATQPTDPPTFIVVSLTLVAVALLASYIPARRATKVDPMVALRYE